MSEIQRLFKALLNHEFYESHKHKIPEKSFDDVGQDLLKTLDFAHNTLKRNVTTSEIYHLHLTRNPMLTTARQSNFKLWLDNLDLIEELDGEVSKLVYRTMWQKEVGRHIMEYGCNLNEGSLTDVEELSSYLEKIGSDFVPQDYSDPVDTDPIALFDKLNRRGKWVLNIPYLKHKIKNLSPGNFVNILARPESGKTATIVHLMASKGGFADQGANVHFIANEESADVTAGRSLCCFNEVAFEDARENPKLLLTPEWAKIKHNLTFLHQPEMSIGQLEYYVKKHRPDDLIVDQLPHLTINGDYSGSHERLGAIYRRARNIASKYNCVVIGVNQASVEAEGKTQVTFSMSEGSKTAIGAACDLVIGVGKTDDPEEGNEVIRHYTVSKNKLTGYHGCIPCKLIQNQSRLTE